MPDRPRHPTLVGDSVRAHRTAASVWAIAGAAFMYLIALSLEHEMARYPGGPKALAESVRGGVEALRPLRWPADRLDSLGGYLWYHNIPLFTLFLSVYAAVQGARAVCDDGYALEELLATGRSRRAVIRARTLGFLVILTVIALVVGSATAMAMAAGGEPRLSGSFITMAASSLCALVAYALGLLISQLTVSSRAAAGLTVTTLVALYVVTNVAGELGAFGVVRYVSPFHYANNSRALVPGFGIDLPSMVALVVIFGVVLSVGAWAFDRRDYHSPLWRRTPKVVVVRPAPIQRRMLRRVWTASVFRGRIGLLAWSLGAATYSAMVAALQPTVIKAWSAFESFGPVAGGRKGVAPAAQYMSFAVELVMPIVAAYVITQASGWVADLDQGRTELILAAPVSWTRLVWERALAATVGAAVVTFAALGGLTVAALVVGAPIDGVGLTRAAVGCLLVGAALAGVAALVVALLRTSAAIIGLAVFVAASYLLGVLVALLEWPPWVDRLSVFTAFGHPYLERPSPTGAVVLLAFAFAGSALAAAAAERTPKVS